VKRDRERMCKILRKRERETKFVHEYVKEREIVRKTDRQTDTESDRQIYCLINRHKNCICLCVCMYTSV